MGPCLFWGEGAHTWTFPESLTTSLQYLRSVLLAAAARLLPGMRRRCGFQNDSGS